MLLWVGIGGGMQAATLVKKPTTMLRAPMLGRVEVLGDDYLSIIKLRRQKPQIVRKSFEYVPKPFEVRLKPDLKAASNEPQIIRKSFENVPKPA